MPLDSWATGLGYHQMRAICVDTVDNHVYAGGQNGLVYSSDLYNANWQEGAQVGNSVLTMVFRPAITELVVLTSDKEHPRASGSGSGGPWEDVPGLPSGKHVVDMVVSSESDYLFCVLVDGSTEAATYYDTWTTIAGQPDNEYIDAIAAGPSGYVYALFSNGRLYRCKTY